MRLYNVISKILFVFIIFTLFLQVNLFAQNYVLNHRKYSFSKKSDEASVPFFRVEVGKPTFKTGKEILTPNYRFSPFHWEPQNYKDGIRGLESQTVTLLSDTSEVIFDWGFYCIDLDSLLFPDSSLVVNYCIVDSATHNILSLALETNVLNSFTFYDSATGRISTEYELLGYRAHSFKSYPGQKVYTKIEINWPSLSDNYVVDFGLTDSWATFPDTASYYASCWRQNSLQLFNSTPTNINFTNIHSPREFILHQNYPNPFNGKTIIPFTLYSPDNVLIEVYDMLGRVVLVIPKRRYSVGLNEVMIDSNVLSSGLYLYSIKTTTGSQVKKFIVIK